MRLLRVILFVVPLAALVERTCAKIRVSTETSTFRDDQNRTVIFHGLNFVEKRYPYYPNITQDHITQLESMGMRLVRLGVMMSGVFPTDETPSTAYLDQISSIIERLYAHGIFTIIDFHQDVLAHKICGEGLPDWMVNVSNLGARNFPSPMLLPGTSPPDPSTGAYHNLNCTPAGPAKFIGWSEFYLTDACGKAFQQIYDGEGLMGKMLAKYWDVVSARFNGTDGVVFYEMMNEPWVGDVVGHPALLLESGKAEKASLGTFMQRMHAIIRKNDPETMILYAPAEVNNRLMRHVGYPSGFLPGEPMAFHTYCITGTDGAGPTTPATIGLCHFNDKFQLSHRESDLRRLRTAGIVTEFGAVSPVPTGFDEVRFVAEHFDAADPPLSWAFWDHNEVSTPEYVRELSRPHPQAVVGDLLAFSFDHSSKTFLLKYRSPATTSALSTEIFLGTLQYPKGWSVTTTPASCCSIANTTGGILVVANKVATEIQIKVVPKH